MNSKWHVAKDNTANSFLLDKESFGALTAKWLQLALAQTSAAEGLTGADADLARADVAAAKHN